VSWRGIVTHGKQRTPRYFRPTLSKFRPNASTSCLGRYRSSPSNI
jgi:hypothetical protein